MKRRLGVFGVSACRRIGVSCGRKARPSCLPAMRRRHWGSQEGGNDSIESAQNCCLVSVMICLIATLALHSLALLISLSVGVIPSSRGSFHR